MKKLSLFDKFIFILNILLALGAFLSYSAAFISPSFFWPAAFFGLGYPAMIALNLCFFLYWLLRMKLPVLLSLAVMLASWNSFKKSVGLNFNPPPAHFENTIKIMSYNIRVFDLYNWSKNKETRNEIFSFLRDENPDILCFQEFFHSEQKDYFTTKDTLVQFLKAKNIHTHYTKTILDVHHFGIATFSSFPIVNKGIVDLKDAGNNTAIYTDVRKNDDTIRIYNAHLASVHFQKQDYKFLEDIEAAYTDEQVKGGQQLLKRLKNAFIKRSSQSEALASHISQSPYKVILCGDFNDTPLSYAYQTISANLSDAFLLSGLGLGGTYTGRFAPLRIDYILHSAGISSYEFRVIPEKFSDHYPVTCLIQLTNDAKAGQ